MIPKRITVAWLRRRKACENQVSIFGVEWPQGASLSRENLLRAAELKLDLDWLAEEILTPPLRDAYQKAKAPLREAYQKATAPLREAYQKAKAPLRKAYQKATAALWDAYQKAKAPLLANIIEEDNGRRCTE